MQSENISIRPFVLSDKTIFQSFLKDYFQNDFHADYSNETLNQIYEHILGYVAKNITYLDLLCYYHTPIGFVNYQIDSPQSDWCEKAGYGTIREFYIQPNYRRQGFGKAFVSYAESGLISLGASTLYLTTDTADAFWGACGYHRTSEKSKGNGDYIYIKSKL